MKRKHDRNKTLGSRIADDNQTLSWYCPPATLLFWDCLECGCRFYEEDDYCPECDSHRIRQAGE